MRNSWLWLPAAVGLSVLSAGRAEAETPRFHGALGAAHAFAGPQETELGWGGGGRIAAELPIGSHFGIQASGSVLSLSEGSPPPPQFTSRTTGVGWTVIAGPRVNFVGAWLDAGGGIAVTGDQVKPAIEARIGYEFRTGKHSPWTVGPFIGYTHVFQTAGAVRPEDANIAWLGLELSLGARPETPVAIVIAKAPPPEPPPPSDRDHDGIVDTDDACPDQPGVRTNDPKTNGCPSDRDHDGIVDTDDACPDVAGVRTDDRSTNGCPATPMRLVGDRVVLDDWAVIHFGFGSPEVHEASRPLVQKIAEYLIALGDVTAVDIEGHADEVGSEAYNLNLSRDRAQSVKKLLEEYGVKATLTVHAYGKKKPVSTGHDELQLRKNRRVDIVVTRQKQVPVEDPSHASK